MDLVAALLAACPIIVLILFTKNRRLWAWWKRSKIVGTVFIAAGVVVVRMGIYLVAANNLDFLESSRFLNSSILSFLILPILLIGLLEVDLTYVCASLIGYHPHPREKMMFHDGMPFHQLENPAILCFANFLLLLPIFLAFYWLKFRQETPRRFE